VYEGGLGSRVVGEVVGWLLLVEDGLVTVI
jgi:hypothetical protein